MKLPLFRIPFASLSSLKQAANEFDASGFGYVLNCGFVSCCISNISFCQRKILQKPTGVFSDQHKPVSRKMGDLSLQGSSHSSQTVVNSDICHLWLLLLDPQMPCPKRLHLSGQFCSLCYHVISVAPSTSHPPPTPEFQQWHSRIFSVYCSSKGLHPANRRHQHEGSLTFQSVESVEWHAHQALQWECKLEGPSISHSISNLLCNLLIDDSDDVSTIGVALSCLT